MRTRSDDPIAKPLKPVIQGRAGEPFEGPGWNLRGAVPGAPITSAGQAWMHEQA